MPTNAIESQVGDVWKSKQAALGTIEPPASTTMKHLRKATEDSFKAAKTYGSEEWVDGASWGSPGMFVDTVGGDIGSITYQAQIETAGAAFASIIGVDVVTGTNPDFTHTITTSTAQGLNLTYYQKVGVNVGPWRNSFWDARCNKLTFTAGQQQKVAHIMENVFAMKAANWFTTDPTAADSGTDPFNWNEVTGSISINSVVLPEVESETFELDRKIEVHRGDSAAPICFVPGKGEITRSMSALVTDTDIPIIKTILYGTTTPTDGQAVSTAVQSVPMTSKYTRSAVRSLQIDTNKVAVDPADFEIGPRPEGGKVPIAFGGRCLLQSGTICTVIAKTGDSAVYI
jgi:hypothetical protein